MTLIKYYTSTTCYDGEKEFSISDMPKAEYGTRFYPDEYLIASILEQYQKERVSTHQFLVLWEPWKGSGVASDRKGSKNTLAFNQQIIECIKSAQKKPKKTLIFAPFLYGYHHPGITIDVNNKTAIYLDPFGTEAHYPEVTALNTQLEKLGFKVLTVTTRQQKDITSCGPILTASMIRFTEEFIANGKLSKISVNGFSEPRPNLATDRMFQMYIHNEVKVEQNDEHVIEELMLADVDLWNKFLAEQDISPVISDEIKKAIAKQKEYISAMPTNWHTHYINRKAIHFIKAFQAQIIEYVFLDKDKLNAIQSLINTSNAYFNVPVDEEEKIHFLHERNKKAIHYNFERTYLLDPLYIPKVHQVLKLQIPKEANVYPNSYHELIAPIPDKLFKAKKILQDYTKDNSTVSLWFHCHFRRHHRGEVHQIVQRIENKNLNSVSEVLKELEAISLVNQQGSLSRRIAFIKEHILTVLPEEEQFSNNTLGI